MVGWRARIEGRQLGSKYNNGDVLGKVMIVGRENWYKFKRYLGDRIE